MAKTAKRKLTLSIEQVSGTFNIFHVWLNGYPVIKTNGSKGDWTGTVPDSVSLEVVAYGIGSASYSLNIDLPGTANDQKLQFQLKEGYHEFKLDI